MDNRLNIEEGKIISTLHKEQLRQSLLAQLAELDSLDQEKPSIPPINSLIPSPAIQPQLAEGQQIAFIHSRIDLVPGTITKLNTDGTYNLEILVPTQTIKIKWKAAKTAFDRVETNELYDQPRLRARLADPRMVYRKRLVELARPERGTEGIVQTHYEEFVPFTKLELPRFHDFHTSLVGTFFDPSIYNFRVYCFRAAREVDGIPFPQEEITFPKKQPFYTSFHKAFNRFFKEYYQGRSRYASKWDIVQIQPALAGANNQ